MSDYPLPTTAYCILCGKWHGLNQACESVRLETVEVRGEPPTDPPQCTGRFSDAHDCPVHKPQPDALDLEAIKTGDYNQATVDALVAEVERLTEQLRLAREESANAWKILNGRADAEQASTVDRLSVVAEVETKRDELAEWMADFKTLKAERDRLRDDNQKLVDLEVALNEELDRLQREIDEDAGWQALSRKALDEVEERYIGLRAAVDDYLAPFTSDTAGGRFMEEQNRQTALRRARSLAGTDRRR